MFWIEQFVDSFVRFLNYVVKTILSILKYSSWQILVLFVAVYYKKIFERMINRTSKFGWGNAEIEFREALDDLDGQATEDASIDNLIKFNPGMAILNSFKDFELACDKKFNDISEKFSDRQLLNENSSYRALRRPGTVIIPLLSVLEKIGVLSILDTESVSTLRRLRNTVAHSNFEVSESDAKRYVSQCDEITQKVNSFQITDENFEEIFNFIASDDRLSRWWRIKEAN